ncbi:DUF309 domain-containing protein [Paenibacillus cisolokensis]|uniref:DUF309 domain-containing protein n=1 Tax=Paenibacillus cisolokensis TaxID=1658519 RepID=UPI003D27B749
MTGEKRGEGFHGGGDAGGAQHPAYDEKYARYIALFNFRQAYYECHDEMEELWLEEGRDPFWQGLLQAAVALHHWRGGNVSGAVKLFRGAIGKLSRYPAIERGLNVADLLEKSERAMRTLSAWLADWRKAGGDTAKPGELPAAPPFEPFALTVADPRLADLVSETEARLPNTEEESY